MTKHITTHSAQAFLKRIFHWLTDTSKSDVAQGRPSPDLAPTHNRLGLLAASQQDWDTAILNLAKAVDLASGDEPYCTNLGVALFKAGEAEDALRVLSSAWENNQQSSDLGANLFVVALHLGNVGVARKIIESSLAETPKKLDSEIVSVAGGELSLMSHSPELWPVLASAKLAMQTGDFPEAEKRYRHMISLRPSLGHAGIGTLAMAKGLFAEALASFAHAIDTAESPNAYYFLNRALALRALQHYDEALDDFARALQHKPDFAEAHFERGTTNLCLGNWTNGWQGYEARLDWKHEPQFGYFDPSAKWHGEPLSGKTLLVVSEQGQGDVIQFIRFVTELSQAGAEIIVFSFPSLLRLIKTIPGVKQVFTYKEPIPAYDFWTPLASLPLHLGLTLDTLRWNTSYVVPPADGIAKWQERLGTSPASRIGLVWTGGDYQDSVWDLVYRRRNIRCGQFAPLLNIPETEFFSLQKGKAREQLAELVTDARLTDYSDEWDDFQDTACFIACLDLIITVDTAIAHLAGAMGKPVWILSRTDGCWRWMDRRNDSPWYPSARIFHQGETESWDEVIARIAAELHDHLARGKLSL